MKIFKATAEIICGEYSFLDTWLFVCKNFPEAMKMAEEQAGKENSVYPEETFYKLLSVDELNYIDNYEINYRLTSRR